MNLYGVLGISAQSDLNLYIVYIVKVLVALKAFLKAVLHPL